MTAPSLLVRRLPIPVAPLPGESIRSVIEEAARRHRVRVVDILSAGDIPIGGSWCLALNRLDHRADDTAAANLSALLGLDPATVRAATLQRWQGTLVDGMQQGKVIHTAWRAVPNAGVYCPRCLAENGGRWMSSWLSPWTRVCRRHEVFCIPTCPECQTVPRARTRGGHHPAPPGTRCSAPLEPGKIWRGLSPDNYCLGDLTDAAVQRAPVASYSWIGQSYVDELAALGNGATVTAPDGSPVPVMDHLRDLRFAARRMHWNLQPDDYGLTPTEHQALETWAAARGSIRSQVRDRNEDVATGTPQANAASAVSYAACVGIAAEILGSDTMETARHRLLPALITEGTSWDRWNPVQHGRTAWVSHGCGPRLQAIIDSSRR